MPTHTRRQRRAPAAAQAVLGTAGGCRLGHGQDLPAVQETRRNPGEGKWQLTPVNLPANSMDRGA